MIWNFLFRRSTAEISEPERVEPINDVVEIDEDMRPVLIKVEPIAQTSESTLSKVSVWGIHLCYFIEDGYRKIKVPGDTRIPGGRYKVKLRDYGSFASRYKKSYSDRKVGSYRGQYVLELCDVPEFSDILIHTGNFPFPIPGKPKGESQGCPLVAHSWVKGTNGHYAGLQSKVGFLKFMDFITDRISEGREIEILIERDDRPDITI